MNICVIVITYLICPCNRTSYTVMLATFAFVLTLRKKTGRPSVALGS